MVLLYSKRKGLYLKLISYENNVDKYSRKDKRYSIDNTDEYSVIRHFQTIVQYYTPGCRLRFFASAKA